jgi:hypothetical protein
MNNFILIYPAIQASIHLPHPVHATGSYLSGLPYIFAHIPVPEPVTQFKQSHPLRLLPFQNRILTGTSCFTFLKTWLVNKKKTGAGRTYRCAGPTGYTMSEYFSHISLDAPDTISPVVL